MEKKVSILTLIFLIGIFSPIFNEPVLAQKKSPAGESVINGTISEVHLAGVFLEGKPVHKDANIYLNEHPGKQFVVSLDKLYKMKLAKKTKKGIEVKLPPGKKVSLTCQKGDKENEFKIIDLITE